MNPKRLFLYLAFLFFTQNSWGFLEAGVGSNSTTGGRIIPALQLAYGGSDWSLSGYMTGTQSEVSYLSSYGANYFWMWQSGAFLSGPVFTGFGLGAIISFRGFKDEGAELEQVNDFAFGPSIKVLWQFAGPFYINLESLFGLRDFSSHLLLNFQDVTTFSLGARF